MSQISSCLNPSQHLLILMLSQVDEYVGGQGGLQQDTQNRYCVNALPHVIGTPEYVFSETVGLHRRREAGPPQEFSDSEEEEDWRAVAAQQNQATVLAVGGGTVFVGGGAAGQDDDWEQVRFLFEVFTKKMSVHAGHWVSVSRLAPLYLMMIILEQALCFF